MDLIRYTLISTVCLSFLYIVYLLFFRNEENFNQLRFYLLISILISFLAPFSNYKINFNSSVNKNITETTFNLSSTQEANQSVTENIPAVNSSNFHNSWLRKNWKNITFGILMIGTIALLIRFLFQIAVILFQFLKSDKEKKENYWIIHNSKFKNNFSFFNLIFLNTNNTDKEDLDQIISHEKIHAAQYHTLDLLMIELLAAVMWFNPLVWMMRNSIQLIHEYLADEGALSTGIDRLRYQALLINQVTEERLICLSSSFNHSLIKKRMIMMTKSKFNQQTKLKILVLIPLTVALFLGVACVNGQNKTNVVAAIAPVKMNVLYLGIDNPVAIAVSGYEPSELSATIDNGEITGNGGYYNVRPGKPGSANIVISANGNEIMKAEFRVKMVPDPISAIVLNDGEFITNGEISKKDLLEAESIVAIMQNFDFDLSFEVVEFVVSTNIEGFVQEMKSTSGKFTENQKDIILQTKPGTRIYIENIVCKGPDGITRKLNAMAFRINSEE